MGTYNKYTECVRPGDYIFPLSAYTGSIVLMLVTVITGPLILLTPYVGLPIAIGLCLIAIAGCRWYLFGRLVCLGSGFSCINANGNPIGLAGEQECAIGMVTGILHPSTSSVLHKYGDNDATMGVLLAPGPTDRDSDLIDYLTPKPANPTRGNPIQGYLIDQSQAILDIGLGYGTSDSDVRGYIKQLHCEFEGSGVRDCLDFLYGLLAALVALLALLLLGAAGWIITILIILVGLLLGGAGLSIFLPQTRGDPTDVNPALGQLKFGDIVIVSGDWIYDSGHRGWNEIHAVHNCQKIGEIVTNADGSLSWPTTIGWVGFNLGLDTPDKVKVTRCFWCLALQDANQTVTGGSKDDPANNWVVHPIIDGCTPPPVIV